MIKERVAVIFGGQSAEHEISVMTARQVARVLAERELSLLLIGIDKAGYWQELEHIPADLLEVPRVKRQHKIPGPLIERLSSEIDIAFPLLHGPYGEDGRIQGLFDMIGLPYVGPDLVGSAVCMDKDYFKRLMKSIGVPVIPSITVQTLSEEVYEQVEEKFSYPVFVKPCNMGSSIGISKVKSRSDLLKAFNLAKEFDQKVLIEQEIKGRELECAALGNEDVVISGVGEIIPSHEFYDYEAKYFDNGASKLLIPAPIEEDLANQLRSLAKKAYLALNLLGLSRIDFFYDEENHKVYLNEINTIPGFTPYSMYPLLWAHEGVDYGQLVMALLSHGQRAFEKRNQHEKG